MNNAITHSFGNSLLAEFVWSDFSDHRIGLINTCLTQEKPNTVESNIAPHAKYNLWESDFNFLEQDNSDISALKLWITYTCQEYINAVNNTNYRFVITDSWAHVTREGGYHLPHYHSNSTWSGIFYIDYQPNSLGRNYWSVPYNLERKPGLEFINDNFSVIPTPGRMILFPSMITHYAEPYIGKQPRILVAFNAKCI